MTTAPGQDLFLDTRSLRAIAHPVRVRILGLLREEGPSTATRLAAQLRLNSGATSYHLRQLAAYDLIVEDTERGSARDRWWRAAHPSTRTPERADELDLGTHPLRLTPTEAGELRAELNEVLDRWRGRHRDRATIDSPDAEPYAVLVHAIRWHDAEPGSTATEP